MPAPIEGRVLPAVVEIRDAEVTGRKWLEGRAVPYGVQQNVGWYIEVIEKGAFAKSIREAANGLPLLLFHDSSSLDALIGRAEKWTEQNDGLHGVWKLETHPAAQRAAELAANGTLGYMSVGFQPIRSTTAFEELAGGDEQVTITRHEARLLETSLTPTPAYTAASVTKVRTLETSLSEAVSGRRIKGWREYLESLGG